MANHKGRDSPNTCAALHTGLPCGHESRFFYSATVFTLGLSLFAEDKIGVAQQVVPNGDFTGQSLGRLDVVRESQITDK
jgi:hypothetical protein